MCLILFFALLGFVFWPFWILALLLAVLGCRK
jgi:hypothetical protein